MKKIEAINTFTDPLYRIDGKVMVVLSQDWSASSDDENDLLSKILGSVKLTLDSVVVAPEKQPVKDLIANYSPSHLICFDSALAEKETPYELTSIEATKVLMADSLNKLDDTRKKKLWNCLKTMFG